MSWSPGLTVFTSLPTPADVQAVATGATGLIEGFQPGSAYFDLSTNAVDVVRALHAAFKEQGIDFLDAPRGAVTFQRRDGGLVCVLNAGDGPIALPAGEVILSSAPLLDDGKLPPDSAAWLTGPGSA